MNGVTETDEKTKEELLGVNQLKRKYFEVWHEADNASGASYDEKIKLFDKVLHDEMEETDWKPTYFEVHFEDANRVERYTEKFLGDGLRYEISDFLYSIHGNEKHKFRLTRTESIAMAGIIEKFLI